MNKINLAGCAIIENNKILLLHRTQNDWYELPGGKIEETETPKETVIRELREELLIDVEIIKCLGQKDFKENGCVMGYTWFLAKIKKGMVPQIGETQKFDHFRYIDLSMLSDFKLSPNMKNFNMQIVQNRLLD